MQELQLYIYICQSYT